VTIPQEAVDSIWEGEDPGYCLAFICAPDGTAIVQADVSTIDLAVYDMAASDTAIYSVTGLSPSTAPAIILDTPAVADGWESNSQGTGGRNFRLYRTLAQVESGGTALTGGHVYRFEHTVHTDAYSGSTGDWGDIKVVRYVKVKALSSA
jgi:hypothetical protein